MIANQLQFLGTFGSRPLKSIGLTAQHSIHRTKNFCTLLNSITTICRRQSLWRQCAMPTWIVTSIAICHCSSALLCMASVAVPNLYLSLPVYSGPKGRNCVYTGPFSVTQPACSEMPTARFFHKCRIGSG